MKKWILWLTALLLLTATGCRAKQEPKPLKVVSEIVVNCENCASLTRRYYNTEEKMQMVLGHIRKVGIQDTPEIDPETLSSRLININIIFSDGSRKVYSLKGNCYFRESGGTWKEISEEKAAEFYLDLLLTPSDEEPPRLFRPRPIRSLFSGF